MKRFYIVVYFSMLCTIGFAKQRNSSLVQRNHDKCKQFLLRRAVFNATVMNTGIGMPPHFVNGRIHPGFELGLQKQLSKKSLKSSLDYSVSLGYFSIASLQRAMYLKPGLGYTILLSKKLFFRPSLNLSLMNVYQSNDEFEFKGNGNYDKVSSARFQVAPSLGLAAGIGLVQLSKWNIGLLLKYEFGVQLPFSQLSSILPLNQIHIGFNFKPVSN